MVDLVCLNLHDQLYILFGFSPTTFWKSEMKKKWQALGLCVVSVLMTGAVAVSAVDKLVIEPRTVSSWGELFEDYKAFRTQMGPIVPPGVLYGDAVEWMSKGDWSFLNENWFFKFDGEVLYVPEESALAKELTLPARIQMREDLKTGEIYIFSAPLTEGEPGEFTGLAAFKAPEFMPYEKDFPLECYLADELAPRRVVWEITLKSEADAWADLIFQRNAAASSELLAEDGMMLMSVPAEHTNDLWLYLDAQNQTINLNIFAPEGFTNRVEIYSSTDLVSGLWSVAGQNLYPSGTNPAVWDATSDIPVRFFRAGNMDIDSDSDGINDARELIMYQSNPNDPNSDGDAYTDYEEVYVTFTDPNNDDTSPPTVWIATPGTEERKAVLP
jgi:hypothetical protein